MSYTCRLYLNSGFNTVNIPDSPALVETLPYIDVPSLEILQNRNLRYIDVKVVSYDGIKNADYCKLGDWFYFIDDIQMLNKDTARLFLYVDYLTSAGGISSLHILDGITSRVHVATDTYGEWTETDPYTRPSQTPDIVYVREGGGGSEVVVVKSTLDLPAIGSSSATRDGVTYTDPATGETVTVPSTKVNTGATAYKLAGTALPTESRTLLYRVSDADIQKALQIVHDLGLDGAITDQIALPTAHVALTGTPAISDANGIDRTVALSTLLYIYKSGIKNNRCFYGEYTPFGIISCAGEKQEFTGAEIYDGQSAPSLRIIGDPHTDGKPYFRFKTLRGDDSLAGFFNNAVAGMQYKNVPMVYQGKSGSTIDAFAQSQKNEQIKNQYDRDMRNVYGNLYGSAVEAGIGAGSLAMGNAYGAGSLASGLSGIINATQTGLETIKKYEQDKKLELEKYLVSQNTYVPTVQFPFNSELMRDVNNNGCLCYQYRYTDFDIARIDKILTMYGYKVTKSIEATDFTNRQKFNYVEASISVGKLPKWHADGISAQISNGVRIWHVLPDNSHYSDNPV